MSEEYAAEEFRKATDALEDARTMHASDGTDEAVVSRCYYACFHAANAALYDCGHEPNTHKGTISLFGQELVLDGPISRDEGRFLNRLRDLRERADYGYDAIDVDVEELLRGTESFLASVDSLIE